MLEVGTEFAIYAVPAKIGIVLGVVVMKLCAEGNDRCHSRAMNTFRQCTKHTVKHLHAMPFATSEHHARRPNPIQERFAMI